MEANLSTRARTTVPAVVWLLHMALPLLGLWLLGAQPVFDVHWEDHPAHFWLVAGVAAVSLALAARVNEQARARQDARLFLVSLAFMTASGFLALHALATPTVLVHHPNPGFSMAAPIGLFLASVVAVLSAVEFGAGGARHVVRWQLPARIGLVLILLAGGALSFARVYGTEGEAHGPLVPVAAVGALLYVVAAAGYYRVHRRRPAAILLSVITAYVLLAEALVAMVYARNWAASWWEWHLLMLLAFGFVAYSAHGHYQREGTSSGLFNSVALEQTLDEVRREHAAAIEALVESMMDSPDEAKLGRVTARLAADFGLTERQAEVLEQGAAAVARERDQAQKLEALVEVGLLSRVSMPEGRLLDAVTTLAQDAFGQVRLQLVRAGKLDHDDELTAEVIGTSEPAANADRVVLPLTVRNRAVGVLEIWGAKRGDPVLRSLASQVSTALENARLYQHLDGLFRSYLSPDVAQALIADPAQTALGGATAEVTVLIADLAGFTTYSESTAPAEVVRMLNTYYGEIVPRVLHHGGTITQFVGDAVIALFNAPVPQPDHAARAARAALDLQAASSRIAKPGWPLFRVGINTGPALVGNIGSESMRHFTAIGDTVNLAARLEGAAPTGGVVISASTRAQLPDAPVTPLPPITVKGKAEPVEAFLLRGDGDG
ncbi:adenylate/guanylate cyclase domain-containing protein [Lentzea tibetensis]|uniref:adenylate/guanylate cyclase domain-containing protein n=1 Tax=Lentzea tibetensis TaxID=2591470 RepID=UPI001C99D6B4|nr:adenylate/guanylate cyclase domain-containing protein [Lentzea tibetensis]